jgi:hypothetical protein
LRARPAQRTRRRAENHSGIQRPVRPAACAWRDSCMRRCANSAKHRMQPGRQPPCARDLLRCLDRRRVVTIALEDAGLVAHRLRGPVVGRDGIAGQPGQRRVRAGDGHDRPPACRTPSIPTATTRPNIFRRASRAS